MSKRMLCIACHFFGLLCTFSTQVNAITIFVDATSTCSSGCNGLTWENAFKNLQNAFQLAEPGDAIWVAKGTYRPHPQDRRIAFELFSGIQLLGGFNGNEVLEKQRDPVKYLTILSGDIGTINHQADNSFTILKLENANQQTIVDGFTIANGQADKWEGAYYEQRGGAIVIRATEGHESSPIIRNCQFLTNYARNDGGAIYVDGGAGGTCSPMLESCRFYHNRAKNGGAIFNNANIGQCYIRIIGCHFIDNEAFHNSHDRGTGGAIYSFSAGHGDGEIQLFNTLFWKNEAYNGGAIYGLSAKGTVNFTVQNCTFYSNDANIGGAIYLNENRGQETKASVANSIFWQSKADTNPHFHFSGNGSAKATLQYSLVDATSCNTISKASDKLDCQEQTLQLMRSPRFRDAAKGDFHLTAASPAVDAGNNELANELILLQDFEGDARTQGALIDLGMDESPYGKIVQGRVDYTIKRSKQTDPVIFGGGNGWYPQLPDAIQGQLKIYPNPSRAFIRIATGSEKQMDKRKYWIFDVQGRPVQFGQLKGEKETKITFERKFNPGMYYIQLEGVDQRLKFVVD